MRLRNAVLLFLVPYIFVTSETHAQDSSIYSKIYGLPGKVFNRISAKSKDIDAKLTKQTEKYLDRLIRHEKALQKKLWKKDSVAAKQLFGNIDDQYAKLKSKFTGGRAIYSSRLDSMQTTLRFLEQNKLLSQSPQLQGKLSTVLGNYTQLQGKLNQTAEIRKYLKERQQVLEQHLEKFGFTREFRRFKKDVYYYRAQVDEYKKIWENPSKVESKLLQLATKIPAFKDFFNKHSALASMFRLPGNNSTASARPIPGLQTRASIQQDLLSRFGTGPDLSRVNLQLKVYQ